MEKGPELHLTPADLAPWHASGLLSGERLSRRLVDLPYWQVDRGCTPPRLTRTWETPDFAVPARLARQLDALAERCHHHPEIRYGWGFIRVDWCTHDQGGIHENDLLLAQATDRLFQHVG